MIRPIHALLFLATVLIHMGGIAVAQEAPAGGSEIGNGGEPRELDFTALGEQALNLISQAPAERYPEINLQNFRAALKTPVRFVDEDLQLDGRPVACVNTIAPPQITCNPRRFANQSLIQLISFSLHEYLGIMGVERNTYVLSARFLSDYRGRFSSVTDRLAITCGLEDSSYSGQPRSFVFTYDSGSLIAGRHLQVSRRFADGRHLRFRGQDFEEALLLPAFCSLAEGFYGPQYRSGQTTDQIRMGYLGGFTPLNYGRDRFFASIVSQYDDHLLITIGELPEPWLMRSLCGEPAEARARIMIPVTPGSYSLHDPGRGIGIRCDVSNETE